MTVTRDSGKGSETGRCWSSGRLQQCGMDELQIAKVQHTDYSS